MIGQRSGCKVGWVFYSTEAEAVAAGKRASIERDSKAQRGYDFGYQWPGSVEHLPAHPEYGECWRVTTP